MTDKIFHFVRNHEVPDWQRVGWTARPALTGTHHGEWSTLMEWTGDGEPVKPFYVSHETVPHRVPNSASQERAHERATSG